MNDEIALKPISKTQGRIFKYVAEKSHFIDFEEFVANYMNSDFCNITMDAIYAYEQLSPVLELKPEIEECMPEPKTVNL